jgi:Reverse transcriptase (RNA-dependent DNA polymerase)
MNAVDANVLPADMPPVEIPGVADTIPPVEIPGVDAVKIPGVDAVEILGVDDLDMEIPGVRDNYDDLVQHMDDAYGARTGQYDLRPRRPRNFDHLFTQHSVKKGLRVFGDAGTAAVANELQQLHDLEVIVPVDPATLSATDKQGALQYLMFLKEKRCGKIKGRGCADGRKQRVYLSKADTSSPTVAIESVFLSCVIDADKQRDVATVDISGAFLHADMNELVYMRIDADMANILINIAPDTYTPFITSNKAQQPVLYVRLKKALYGTLQAALLFYEKLSSLLVSWSFVISPYDRCVANKHINGSICTILWHVDDFKISHSDPTIVDG